MTPEPKHTPRLGHVGARHQELHDENIRLNGLVEQIREELDEIKVYVVGYDGDTDHALKTLVANQGRALDVETHRQDASDVRQGAMDHRQDASDARQDASDRGQSDAGIRQDTADKIASGNAAKQGEATNRAWLLHAQIIIALIAAGGITLAVVVGWFLQKH